MNYEQRQRVYAHHEIEDDDVDQLPGRRKIGQALRYHVQRLGTELSVSVRTTAKSSGMKPATLNQILAASPKPAWSDYVAAGALVMAGA